MIPAALAPLVAHLWQSTLFAAVAALLVLALRRNQGRVRYWVWLAASCKFLLPFSWLVSIGHLFQLHSAPAMVPYAFTVATEAVSAPMFLISAPSAQFTAPHASEPLIVIAAVWVCGFIAVVCGWMREWLRIRAIVRAALPLSLGVPIRAVSTTARVEPGVFGIWRPILLLPKGIAERLTQAQLQAVLAHEVCHVRRRDNLTAALHMLVEAIFWFYPLVWWLGSRLIDERERACDEEVLRAGSEAQAYAESILKVCEFYLESPLTCVSGISGSDLKKRVARIMARRLSDRLNLGRKIVLTLASLAAIAGPVVFGIRVLAQSQEANWQKAAGSKMAFDVASVKPNKSNDRPTANVPLGLDDVYTPTGGLFRTTDTPFYSYVRFAYKINGFPEGLPNWGMSERFDVEAKAQGNPTKDQYRLMMQSLLAERFKMSTHKETRQMPIYALVVAKDGKFGPQFTRDDGPCSTSDGDVQALNGPRELPQPAATPNARAPKIPCGALLMVPGSLPGRVRVAGTKVPIALLTRMLPNPASGLDRPVFDRTNLSGTFDMAIEWAPAITPPGGTVDDTGPNFTEAIQDQLGLKLVPQTGPVDVLVIDHIEELSPN